MLRLRPSAACPGQALARQRREAFSSDWLVSSFRLLALTVNRPSQDDFFFPPRGEIWKRWWAPDRHHTGRCSLFHYLVLLIELERPSRRNAFLPTDKSAKAAGESGVERRPGLFDISDTCEYFLPELSSCITYLPCRRKKKKKKEPVN